MKTSLISSCKLDKIRFVSWLSDDRFVAASQDELIWYRVIGSSFEEVSRSTHGARSFPMFSIREHSLAVLQLERHPENCSFQFVGSNGLKEKPVSIPLLQVYQVTTNSRASILAAYGAINRGHAFNPVESCLIDVASGTWQRLPYAAVAISNDALYFVKDRTVYRRRLTFLRAGHDFFRRSIRAWDESFAGEPIQLVASDQVLYVDVRDDCVWLATQCGLSQATTMDVALVHKWDFAIRVGVCADVFFAATIGPELYIYDTRNRVASCITSSSGRQVTGFDAICLSCERGVRRGVLLIVGEFGVVDLYSWVS